MPMHCYKIIALVIKRKQRVIIEMGTLRKKSSTNEETKLASQMTTNKGTRKKTLSFRRIKNFYKHNILQF